MNPDVESLAFRQMNRRKFVATSLAALGGSQYLMGAENASSPQLLEWICYEVQNNSNRPALIEFLGKTVIPHLNRYGCEPVGLFRPKYGMHGGDICLLVPHSSFDSFRRVWKSLNENPEFIAAANTEMESPLYDRMRSSLMVAFSHMPTIEVPSAIAGKRDRIFELRTYESHNRLKLDLKVEMFNEGGEIQLFRDTGLHPVFFGEMIIGENMPNLTYMLGFENMEQRDQNWQKFSTSDAWQKMREIDRYKQSVSAITDTILVPLNGSQI